MISILFATAIHFAVPDYIVQSNRVNTYIESSYGKYWKRTKARVKRDYTPIIIEKARKYDLDPVLIAVVISLESDFKEDARSPVGAYGLGQLKGVSTKGVDMKTAEGQIDGMAKWQKHEIDKCDGSILKGINAYMTKGGVCSPIISRAKYRYRIYRKAAR